MFLLLLCSQYLAGIQIPIFLFNRTEKCHTKKLPIFKLFPVIIAVAISWLICLILTLTNVLPDDPDAWGYYARTDTKIDVLKESKWIRVPYPGIIIIIHMNHVYSVFYYRMNNE